MPLVLSVSLQLESELVELSLLELELSNTARFAVSHEGSVGRCSSAVCFICFVVGVGVAKLVVVGVAGAVVLRLNLLRFKLRRRSMLRARRELGDVVGVVVGVLCGVCRVGVEGVVVDVVIVEELFVVFVAVVVGVVVAVVSLGGVII